MAKDIDPKLCLLKDYLTLGADKIFAIPPYQRKYSWTINQCDKLWQDIERFKDQKANDPYFFGTIIADCALEQTDGKINLIDGQQRTTTFLLLLKALLIKINDVIKTMAVTDETEGLKESLIGNRKTIIKILYKIEDEDIPAFLKNSKPFVKQVIENNSINELYKDEIQKIISADTFAESERIVTHIPYKQKDNRYTQFFKNFKYFYDKIDTQKSETQINEFAKTLLNKCQVIEIKSWNIEQAIVMFNSLNSDGLPLTDADILSADLFSKCGNDEKKKAFIDIWQEIVNLVDNLNALKITNMDEILNQYMYIKRAINNESDTTLPSMRSYFRTIHSEFLNAPEKFATDLCDIIGLWVASDNTERRLIQKVLLKFNSNFKLFYIPYLFIKKDEPDENKNNFIKTLLKLFVLFEIVDVGYPKSKTFLFGLNMSIGENKNTDFLISKITDHIAKNFKPDDIYNRLIEINASGALVFLNEILYALEKGKQMDFADKNYNIEHIMPKSGRNFDTIRHEVDIETQDEFNICVDEIGNKILLEEKINKKIGDDWFKTKKKGYKTSVFPLANKLANYKNDKWKKDDIKKASEKAAKRICKFIFGETDNETK